MSLLDDLSKNPKLDDLVELIGRLEERIDELQLAIADHQAGAQRRQQEMDKLKSDGERIRWSLRTGRKP